MSTNTTSIRVAISTRDRLNALVDELGKPSVEALLNFLIDHHWENRCVAQADQYRQDNPGAWRAELREVANRERFWTVGVSAE